MKKQHGTVLVFKDILTKKEIEAVLAQISSAFDNETKNKLWSGDLVREFNPSFGGPVWYIP